MVCRVLFGEENVGLLTCDAIVNREALILIMTTEFFCNMLYQRCSSPIPHIKMSLLPCVGFDFD